MAQHLLKWKTVRVPNVRNEDYDSRLPYALDFIYRGTLVTRVLSMEKKVAIGFKEAFLFFQSELLKSMSDPTRDRTDWLYRNFIPWISGLGYHIELTGDEFEPFLMSDKVS